jgi:hypothetical protein
LAKACFRNVLGNPTLGEVREVISKCEKLLFEKFAQQKITHAQALNRQYINNVKSSTGKYKPLICIDDFIELPNGEMYKVNDREHREIQKVMNSTLKKNPRLKTFEGKLVHNIK